jgi:cytoskeletal protein RodZ
VIEIGTTLRDERLRQGLSLADVEQRTRIKEMFLAALEEERFDLLPGDAYARAFLRTYADLLGLDGQALVAAYQARVPPPHQGLRRASTPAARPGRSMAAPVALGVVAVIALIIISSGGGSSDERPPASAAPTGNVPPRNTPTAPAPAPPPEPAPAPQTARLSATGAFDPDGDGREHDEQAAQATDGDAATFWATESYSGGLPKPGVGLVLDAGKPVSLSRLVLTTDTPGFTAQIKAADAAAGPYTEVSASQAVAATTRFTLRARTAQYYLVWITQLDGVAHVNEARGVVRPTNDASTAR